MFKKRKGKEAAATKSPSLAASSSPLSAQRQQQLDDFLSSSSPPNARPPLSPLKAGFDFDLPSPAFGKDSVRPSTSDGTGPRKSSLSSLPPILPPIPRVSSQTERGVMDGNRDDMDRDAILAKAQARFEQIRINGSDGRSGLSMSGSSLDYNVDAPTLPRPMIKNQDVRPSTAGESSTIKMEPSLFPTKAPLPTLSIPDADTPMSRALVDARDKTYSSPPIRPQLQSANSSPDLRITTRPTTATGTPTRTPLTTLTGNSSPRPVPQQSFSTGNMSTLARPPSNAPTNYSGTTARSTFSSKSTAMGSDVLIKTIGTPYGETSSSFPLPQHVSTRPKTAGSMATVRGVEVPTHHTSALKAQPQPPPKGEKRKTKLLNPMNLLGRKRAGQDDETVTVDRAAQARQKDVAAAGVSRLPEDFDPRIRGKVVHDFSAPRASRQFSYNDAVGSGPRQGSGEKVLLQSSNSAPFIPTLDQGDGGQRACVVSDGSPRKSSHMPMFREHLDTGEGSLQTDAAAVQAERLENKAFLNRVSQVSQESGVLPPFARRSQQVEVPSASASSPSDDAQREADPRASTSSSGVSPITTRGSVLPSALDTRQSISPVSPATPDKPIPFSRLVSRPVSEVSRLGSSDGKTNQRMSEVSRLDPADIVRPGSNMSAVSDMTVAQGSSDVTTRFVSAQPTMEPIVEQLTPKLGDTFAPWPEMQPLQPPVTPQRENDSSIVPTPETAALKASGVSKSSSGVSKSPPRLAQKRDDAVGHAKRMSSGTVPKPHVSNASRFSFQFGGSALEEQILEEKGRRLTLDTNGSEKMPSQDFDDEDYFDEDAMDDMDEMEMEDQQQGDLITGGMNTTGLPISLQPESAYMPTFMPMADARQKLQFDSDGESDVASGEETPYWKHDAFGSYAHTRDHSISEDPAAINLHQRKRSDEASKLTLNTNVGPNGSAFVQDGFAGDGNARSGFYMQPAAAGYSPTSTRAGAAPPPSLPDRNSGNSEQNRIGSGLQVAPQPPGSGSTHRATISNSTMGSLDEIADRSFSGTGVQSTPSTETTGLGLSGFSGFKFVDSPPASRPQSGESQKQRYLSRPVGADRSRGDSETLPQTATFGLATSTTGRGISPAQDRYMDDQYDLDDMYFDDGGFEPDVNDRNHIGEALDEDVFDDDNFLKKPNGVGNAVQPAIPNGAPSLEFMGIGSDGPYPSFTLPKSKKARDRDSQFLLEDLPLYEQPFDPKWIPRRNPSEDAKRLGLSKKAPPLPPQGMSVDAAARVQANLMAYHAALADAANKAAADGRFSRMPSTSTTRSKGIALTDEDADAEDQSQDDVSNHSLLENDDATSTIKGNSALNSHDPKTVPDSNLPMAPIYSPSKMSFDFGFDSAPLDDSVLDSDFEDLMGDDDIVAAANAEALASDEDGFYGQEFGFYAKARPNSSEVEAINGGFFGLDGDDGLARQKSLKEPNLTPITERSEFSTRNSFIGLGMGGHGSAGPFSPYQRLPVSPWVENEVTTFDQLRKLKASAFGGSNISLHSDSSGGLQMNPGSAPVSARSSAAAQGYFGPLGGAPMTYGYSTESSSSSNPSSAHPHQILQVQDSPHSATSSSHLPLTMDPEATPKRPSTAVDTPMTVRKISDKPNRGHSRTSSGADSVTYVREEDPEGNRPPRWVLEKRRTSEQGQLELVAREVVQDGWI